MHIGLPHWFPGEVFFFFLSRRAAVNFSHQRGGQLGGTGSQQPVLWAQYSELSGNTLHGAVQELLRTLRFLRFHWNDSRHNVYLTSQPKRWNSTVINWIVVPAEIGSLIDNHRKGHCCYNSGRKIIMLKWIVFSQLSCCLEAHAAKQNTKTNRIRQNISSRRGERVVWTRIQEGWMRQPRS